MGAQLSAPPQKMEENNQKEPENKTPSKMARIAWPKSIYGVIAAIIIIVLGNIIYYKDFLLSLIRN